MRALGCHDGVHNFQLIDQFIHPLGPEARVLRLMKCANCKKQSREQFPYVDLSRRPWLDINSASPSEIQSLRLDMSPLSPYRPFPR